MKIFNKGNKILTSVLVSSTIMFSLVPTNFASEQIADAGKNVDIKTPHSYGYVKPTEEGYKWIDENVIKTEQVGLNELGFERVNKARKMKKLKELEKDIVVKNGDEAAGTILKSGSKNLKATASVSTAKIVEPMQNFTSTGATYSLGTDSLPASVDNSLLPAFPPIEHQKDIGSCAAFSTAYYQMTHMTALAQGWNTKDPLDYSKRFSPKWAYNFTNNGKDDGTSFDKVYRLISKSGCATWQDFPYDGKNIPKNYLEWPTQSSVYKNAMKNKIDKIGCLAIYDGTDTPVKGPQDKNLNQLKTLLSDGYVLTFATDVLSWVKNTLKNDPATPSDDDFVDQIAYYMIDGFEGGHAMTVVGYNDDVWCDVNGNGKVEIGEKGALKIANSWGTGEDNNGFMWLCYDALNRVSSVDGAPEAIYGRSFPLYDNNRLYWITVKKDYTPKLIAEFTVKNPKRRQFSASLGYSIKYDKVPSLSWKPIYIADSNGGDYAFDGTNTPCNATFALDFTDLYSNSFSNPDGNWYLKIKDDISDNAVTNLYNFKLIDNVKGTEINSANTFPVKCNGGSSTLSIYNTRNIPQTTEWTIQKSMPERRNNFASAGLDGNIYVFGGNTENYYSSNSVFAYNTSNNTWSNKANMPVILNYPSAIALNDKILITGYQDTDKDRKRVVYEYNPSTDTYKQQSILNYNVVLKKSVTSSGYDSGGEPKNAIDDNTFSSKWSSKSNRDKWIHIDLGANYKINRWVVRHAGSALDSVEDNTRDFSLQKSDDGISWTNVDPVIGNTSNTTDRIVSSFTTRYIGLNITKSQQNKNEVANIYEFQVYGTNTNASTVSTISPSVIPTALEYKGKSKMVLANSKIYISDEYNNNNRRIEEYDPATGIITYKTDIPISISEPAITSINNKIYIMGGRDTEKDLQINSVYVFDTLLNKWSAVANMPTSKITFDAESINGKIYTFGGYLWGQTYCKNIEEYNPLTDTWTTKSFMLQDLDCYNLVNLNNKIYSLGGNFYNTGSTKLVASFQ